MNKWNEVPEALLRELVQEADFYYPIPKEGDYVESQPVVMCLGTSFYVGHFRVEYDVYAGWIPLPHTQISGLFQNKGQAVDEYIRIVKEQSDAVQESRSNNSSCSS